MKSIVSWDKKKIKDSTVKMAAVKIAVGSVLAILIAQRAQLDYASSAGIITLLTVMNTRKETFTVAAKRCAAFVIAMLLSGLLFGFLGYEVWVFGVFLLLFYLLTSLLDIKEGFSMNAVLVTHLLAGGAVSWSSMLNETGIFLIGIAAAILVNSYMPDRTLHIRDQQRRTENQMRILLKELADALASGDRGLLDEHIRETAEELRRMERSALDQAGNSFQNDDFYFVKYVEMRMNQTEVLENMSVQLEYLTAVTPQAQQIAAFFRHIGETFHETNNAQGLLEELYTLRSGFQKSRLPEERTEFENRAVLFHMLHLMEYFLKLKQKFAEQMTEEERKHFWNVYSRLKE